MKIPRVSPSEPTPLTAGNDVKQGIEFTGINSLTVDVEEYFQVGGLENSIDRSDWDKIAGRLNAPVEKLLGLLEKYRARATFFTLGWVGERYPKLIRSIVNAGHEIASHGYDHKRVFIMTAEDFHQDLERSRKILEDATGQAVTGYRAPNFSIGYDNAWAWQVLEDAGYHYSSSVIPVSHDHYGDLRAPRFAHSPPGCSRLVEIPVSTVCFCRRNIAIGGGFFRLYPFWWSKKVIRRVNTHDRQAVIFYTHPWEFDPDQPKVSNAPLRSRFRHYVGLKGMAGKLEKLLQIGQWDRLDRLYHSRLCEQNKDLEHVRSVD